MKKQLFFVLMILISSLGFSQNLEATIKAEALATEVFRSQVEPVVIYRNNQFLGCGVLTLNPAPVTWLCGHFFFQHDGVFKATVIGNGKNSGYTYYINDPQEMVIAGDTLDAAYCTNMSNIPLDTIQHFSDFDPTILKVEENRIFTKIDDRFAQSLVDGKNYVVLGTVGVAARKTYPHYFVVKYPKAEDGRVRIRICL